MTTYRIDREGKLAQLSSVPSGQSATCWVASDGDLLFASNAGSAKVSGYRSDGAGDLALLGATATDAGTVDATTSPDGKYLYVQAGAAGIVDEFAVYRDGSLTAIGAVTVADAAGAEGIVAI